MSVLLTDSISLLQGCGIMAEQKETAPFSLETEVQPRFTTGVPCGLRTIPLHGLAHQLILPHRTEKNPFLVVGSLADNPKPPKPQESAAQGSQAAGTSASLQHRPVLPRQRPHRPSIPGKHTSQAAWPRQ